ncbi:MAG TPA: hypothetical protein VH855_19095 [Acetobacteraceae bacterium]|jgi:hypothetical protein
MPFAHKLPRKYHPSYHRLSQAIVSASHALEAVTAAETQDDALAHAKAGLLLLEPLRAALRESAPTLRPRRKR